MAVNDELISYEACDAAPAAASGTTPEYDNTGQPLNTVGETRIIRDPAGSFLEVETSEGEIFTP